jgi:putative copper resistance protein D
VLTAYFDVAGFLAVVLRGLILSAQTLVLGGVAFHIFIAAPTMPHLGPDGPRLLRRVNHVMRAAAVVAAGAVFASVSLTSRLLIESAKVDPAQLIDANYVQAGLAAVFGYLALAAFGRPARSLLLLGLAIVIVAGSTATSHAAAQLHERGVLLAADAIHQSAAGAWIGGIPYLLFALARFPDGASARLIGRRFSLMAMVAVAALGGAGFVMGLGYIDSIAALYGTAYGLMVSTKVLLFGVLLAFGAANFRLVERLRADPTVPSLRLRRFAEAEVAIGLAVLFTAASLTSLPPATDLRSDRPTGSEVIGRLTPRLPSLSGPMLIDLPTGARSIVGVSEAARLIAAGDVIDSGRADATIDVLWSEFNHNWAGIFVLALGLLALLERTGLAPWGRHWPLIFLPLSVAIFIFADPENWPIGPIPFAEGFKNSEITQHRLIVPLIAVFGLFEWAVRTGRIASARLALVFPVATGLGSALLLLHTHSVGNPKAELLIEWTHVPLALLALAAAIARWLELRLPPSARAIPAAVWPICFILVGLLLLTYREMS